MCRRLVAPGYASLVALLSILHSHTIFLSDFFAADVPYAFLSVALLRRRAAGPVAGLLAVAAYATRSAGIALLGAWVAESLLRRRLPQAAVRGAVALAAVGAWLGYTTRVRAGAEYAATQPTSTSAPSTSSTT